MRPYLAAAFDLLIMILVFMALRWFSGEVKLFPPIAELGAAAAFAALIKIHRIDRP